MFFEMISPTGKKNYLFGTLHLNDKEIVSLPLEVKEAFENASRVVTETDLTQQLSTAIFYYINKWKRNNHTEKCPPIIKCIIELQEALGEERFDSFLDEQIANESKRRGKKFGFLQTPEEQAKALIGYPFDEFEQAIYYAWVVKDGLNVENINKALEILKKSYLTNDLNAILANNLSLNAPEIVYKYQKSLRADRDIIQAEAMKPFMEEGNVFFAVGAAHLLGITEKLKAEGYTVNPVPLSKRIYSISDCKQTLFNKDGVPSIANQDFRRPGLG